MAFNQVILLANLTRDPQIKHLPSNTQVCEFGVACNRKYKTAQGEEREEVAFVDCTAFGKTAELIGQYFTKGKPIFVQGRLKYDTWDDKNGGGKRSKLTVMVESFQFVGGRDGGGGGEQQEERQPQRPAGNRTSNRPAPKQPFGDDEQFKEDDIPF